MAEILDLPFVVRAEGVLRDEHLVTLDPSQGIVYKALFSILVVWLFLKLLATLNFLENR